jgi:hypothetical protein
MSNEPMTDKQDGKRRILGPVNVVTVALILPIAYTLSAILLACLKDTFAISGAVGESIELYNMPLERAIRLAVGVDLW